MGSSNFDFDENARNDARDQERRKAEARRLGAQNPWKMEIVLDESRDAISERGVLPRRYRPDRRDDSWPDA